MKLNGSTVLVEQDAVDMLELQNIRLKFIDKQTLLPFDIHHKILDSLRKTNRIVFVNEDIPEGMPIYVHQVNRRTGGIIGILMLLPILLSG